MLVEVKNLEPAWAATTHEDLCRFALREGAFARAEAHARASLAVRPLRARRADERVAVKQLLAQALAGG